MNVYSSFTPSCCHWEQRECLAGKRINYSYPYDGLLLGKAQEQATGECKAVGASQKHDVTLRKPEGAPKATGCDCIHMTFTNTQNWRLESWPAVARGCDLWEGTDNIGELFGL